MNRYDDIVHQQNWADELWDIVLKGSQDKRLLGERLIALGQAIVAVVEADEAASLQQIELPREEPTGSAAALPDPLIEPTPPVGSNGHTYQPTSTAAPADVSQA